MATEAIIEEVATNFEEAAVATRRLNGTVISSFVIGLGVGAAVGFYVGYRYSKKKLRAEILAEADEEIEKMREFFQNRELARQAEANKPSAGELVLKRGYIPHPPDSVRPLEPWERPTRPPVPVQEPLTPPTEENDDPVVKPATIEQTPGPDPTWDYRREFQSRRSGYPYVIHRDEVNEELPGYNTVHYIYYPSDNVLCDEDGSPLADPLMIVGEEALLRFGQGSGDPNIVFVRNDKLNLHIEIVQLEERSYEEDVLGLSREPEE